MANQIQIVLQTSFLFGLILSFAMVILFGIVAWINPEAWLKDYPPDIQEIHGPMSPEAERFRKIAGLPVFLVLGFTLFAGLMVLSRQLDGLTFWQAFSSVFVMLAVFNLVDLLVLDWLIFVIIQPRRIVLPGTEGAAGYKDYGFHVRQGVKGLAGSLVAALLLAGTVVAIQAALA
jgi:hypothetical protein